MKYLVSFNTVYGSDMPNLISDKLLLQSIAPYRGSDRFGPVSEKIIRSLYEKLLTRGDTVIDVGVHYGIHMFPMADAVGAHGEVIGIEASPERFNAIKKRIINEGYKNIHVYNFAAGNFDGTTGFFLNVSHSGYSGTVENKKTDNDIIRKIVAESRKIDSILGIRKKVSFIKIDVEGAESRVLIGAKETIRFGNPFIIFEGRLTNSAKICGVDYSLLEHCLNGYFIFDLFGVKIDSTFCNGDGWNFLAVPSDHVHLNLAAIALESAWKQLLS